MALPPFQQLLDAHGPDVHRFLVAIVGRADAEDCYQETWIAALRGYPKLRSDGNLRGWVLTIAQRKAVDHFRASRRRAEPVAELDSVGTSSDGLPEVWSLVGELPAKQRTAVALRFLTDSRYAEIGTVMGTSEEAARRNVHEGLKRLRAEYSR